MKYLQDYGNEAPPLRDFGPATIGFFRALQSTLVQTLFMNPGNLEAIETLAAVKDCVELVESGIKMYGRFHRGRWYFAVDDAHTI